MLSIKKVRLSYLNFQHLSYCTRLTKHSGLTGLLLTSIIQVAACYTPCLYGEVLRPRMPTTTKEPVPAQLPDKQESQEVKEKRKRMRMMSHIGDSIEAWLESNSYSGAINFAILWPALEHSGLFQLTSYMEMAASYEHIRNNMALTDLLSSLQPENTGIQTESNPYALFFLAISSQRDYYQFHQWPNPNEPVYSQIVAWLQAQEFDLNDLVDIKQKLAPYYQNQAETYEDLDRFLKNSISTLNDISPENDALPLFYSFAYWKNLVGDLENPDINSRIGNLGHSRMGSLLETCHDIWSGRIAHPRVHMVQLFLDHDLLQESSPVCEAGDSWECTLVNRRLLVKIQAESGLEQQLGKLLKGSRHKTSAWLVWGINPYRQNLNPSGQLYCNGYSETADCSTTFHTPSRKENKPQTHAYSQDLSHLTLPPFGREGLTLASLLMAHLNSWEVLLEALYPEPRGLINSIKVNSAHNPMNRHQNEWREALRALYDRSINFQQLCNTLRSLKEYKAEEIIRHCLESHGSLHDCPEASGY